ncbi:MAG: Ni/Fe hydrogenase subunit alpha [Planctomycetota bacterium]|jgi:NAD-reducing hydrogenase large subunit
MVSVEQKTKRVAIEPLTRVEGHGKVTILLDEAGQVRQARLHIVEFRGFERFVRGRPYWELPVLVQRLCGICPVSHHLCAAKAVDRLVGGERLTPTAEKMRRLMHHGQMFQSHALHFFFLASPDLLFGFDADPAVRNIAGVATKHPELAKQGIRMRQFGQEIIRVTAGKKVHGTGAIPGGINRNLPVAERDELLGSIDQMIRWSRDAVDMARDYTLEHVEELRDYGAFPSNHLCLVADDGAMDLYDGGLRAIDPEGGIIFDHMDVADYLQLLAEGVRSWSYMKFPFIRSLGEEQGWYRVGPLSRIVACDHIDTPQAEAARQEFMSAFGNRPAELSMAYHWARMIEVLHAAETIERLLHDPDLQGTDLVVKGEPRREAVAALEAPRGTLFHHYRIDEDGLVDMANLVVSTTSNNEPMNRAIESTARRLISGQQITEGLLNRIEVVVRAYDPCLSCATHALGRMPLYVELHDHRGAVVATATKE